VGKDDEWECKVKGGRNDGTRRRRRRNRRSERKRKIGPVFSPGNEGRKPKFAEFFQNEADAFSPKRFDRGHCDKGSLIVPNSKREGRQDRRMPAVPRTK
jgi:hypothetical protein